MEGEQVDVDINGADAPKLANMILEDPSIWGDKLDTARLAVACAQLDVEIDAEKAELAHRSKALDDACRVLSDRFAAEGISQIRVETTEGRRLVHRRSTYFLGVLAENKPAVQAWLKEHAPQLVKEAYNESSLRAYVKKAHLEGDGEYPEALIDAGIIKVTQGTEVAFRKSS